MIVERIKSFANRGESVRNYFWRTYGGAEVDYLEKPLAEKEMRAFEIKYTQEALSKGAKLFSETYSVPVSLINKDNYFDFIQN